MNFPHGTNGMKRFLAGALVTVMCLLITSQMTLTGMLFRRCIDAFDSLHKQLYSIQGSISVMLAERGLLIEQYDAKVVSLELEDQRLQLQIDRLEGHRPRSFIKDER